MAVSCMGIRTLPKHCGDGALGNQEGTCCVRNQELDRSQVTNAARNCRDTPAGNTYTTPIILCTTQDAPCPIQAPLQNRPTHPGFPAAAPRQAAGEEQRRAVSGHLDSLRAVLELRREGKAAYACSEVSGLLREFLEVEEAFRTGGQAADQDVVDSLRQVCSEALYGVAWETRGAWDRAASIKRGHTRRAWHVFLPSPKGTRLVVDRAW